MKKNTKTIFLIILLVLFGQNLESKTQEPDSLSVVVTDFFVDNPIAAMMDSLAASVLFAKPTIAADTAVLNIYGYAPDEVPEFADSIYEQRFELMRTKSPMPFVYHEDVSRFINVYAKRYRRMTSRLLGLAEFYFPLFEEQLAKHNLPLELKYLAVIESALNPKAVSRAGAAGLWQFMYRTGRHYGLQVTSYVDDRFDPYKSTVAACEHFVDLYRIYGDWNLVLAAYNAGSGNVNRAIRRAGGKTDYWEIRRFLPRETRSYVPIFMAASYVMMHPAEHNLYPVYPAYLFEKMDTVTVKQKLSFDQISQALNISVEELEVLNPSFKRNVIPSSPERFYKLKMPVTKVGEFLANESYIYNFKTLEQLIKEDYLARNPEKNFSADRTHTVRSGESLHVIARRYGVRVNDLQSWNNIRGTTIHPGQRLVVSIAPPELEQPKPPKNTIIKKHIAQPNESLRCVAELFETTVDNIRLWNQIKDLRLMAGQELIIHVPVLDTTDSISIQSDLLTLAVNEDIPHENIEKSSERSVPKNENMDIDEVQEEKNKQSYTYYTVRGGDTLWDIVRRHGGVSVSEVKQLNNLTGSSIRPGQRLKLPVNSN